MIEKLNPYTVCPCGSGKKVKFCCSSKGNSYFLSITDAKGCLRKIIALPQYVCGSDDDKEALKEIFSVAGRKIDRFCFNSSNQKYPFCLCILTSTPILSTQFAYEALLAKWWSGLVPGYKMRDVKLQESHDESEPLLPGMVWARGAQRMPCFLIPRMILTEFTKALDEAFHWEDELIIEEFVQGREFSCGVIEGKALPVIEIAPLQGFYDYKNKYQVGSAIETCPAELPEDKTAQMQQYAERVFKALRLKNYARMDFMMDAEGNMYCLEANTLPGMTPTSLLPQEAAAVGISYEALCEKILMKAFAR